MKFESIQSTFEDLCRICCTKYDSDSLISVFEDEDLLEKITLCLPITIHEGDNLPHVVCTTCLGVVNSCHDLITRAQSSEEYFFQCIKNCETLVELIDEKPFSKAENQDEEKLGKKSDQLTLNLDGSFNCDLCGLQLSEALDLDNHIQEKHINTCNPPNTQFSVNKICSLCGQLFEGDDVYMLHKCETHHKCSLCDKTMPSKCLLNRHIQHSCKHLYFCPYCHKTFSVKVAFLRHVKGHTGADTECLACDRMRGATREITEHTCSQDIMSSLPAKPYKCYICGQAYKRQLNLARHCLQHEPKAQWQYKCSKCDEVFEKEKKLHTHYEKVHKMAKTWVCRFCGKSLSTKLSVQIHERIHTQVKPFVCEWCGNRFRCKANLIQHHAMHTGIRRHKCHICGKMFSRPFFLKTHLRVHTGERPYQCDLCEKRFTQMTDMKRHRKRHDKVANNYQMQEQQMLILVEAAGDEPPQTLLPEVTHDSFPIETVELKIETSYD